MVKKEKFFLIGVLLASLVVRCTFFAAYTRHHLAENLVFDAEQYHNIAVQIAHGNGITTNEGTPNFYRLPGYPLFLAACYKIYNFELEKTMWLQVVLASAIPLLVWLLGMVMLPAVPYIARGAALLSVFHLGFIVYAGLPMSETLFLFFFLLFLILFFAIVRVRGCDVLQFSDGEQRWIMLCAGTVLGIASLIRAVGHYVIVLALIFIACAAVQKRKKILYAMLLSSGWFVVVSIWLVRNLMLTGALFFHTLPGLHFLQYSAVYVMMDVEDLDYFQAKKKVLSVWDKKVVEIEKSCGRKLSEYERFACAERLAYKILAQYPLLAIKHACIHMIRTCGTLFSTLLLYVPRGTVYGKDASLWFKIKLYLNPRVEHRWLIFPIYWELLLSLFVVLGMIFLVLRVLRDDRARCLLATMMPFIILFVGITLAYGCARLRMPIEPFLLIGAVYGWLGSYCA
jgi:hypothetical protein